jgi:hypothetical protein
MTEKKTEETKKKTKTTEEKKNKKTAPKTATAPDPRKYPPEMPKLVIAYDHLELKKGDVKKGMLVSVDTGSWTRLWAIAALGISFCVCVSCMIVRGGHEHCRYVVGPLHARTGEDRPSAPRDERRGSVEPEVRWGHVRGPDTPDRKGDDLLKSASPDPCGGQTGRGREIEAHGDP